MRVNVLWILLVLPVILTQCVGNGAKENPPQVKNVIVMIGDGMGLSQAYAGMTANKGNWNMERCQYTGFSKTWSADNYVTDSGAGGTAIACGVKTNNGTIGMDADKNKIKSMLAYAADNGLSTGVVVTCELTHATPAAFIAHQPDRNMVEEIAADYLLSDVTVCIGGGRDHFEKRKDGQNIAAQMEAKGYQTAYTIDDVKKITSGKLLGLLADKHPAAYPERGNMLPDAVKSAIDILAKNKDGFFLMVEGSQIDWACHANDPEYLINEVSDFDRTVKVAFDFAQNNPGTLVIVTADHETGGLTLNGGDIASGKVETAFTTKGHTGVMVPVYAFGTGAEMFTGIYQNADILNKVLQLYGIKKDNVNPENK